MARNAPEKIMAAVFGTAATKSSEIRLKRNPENRVRFSGKLRDKPRF
jgi:hypothetical protein